MILIIIGVIVYFVVTSGEDDAADETPTDEETTSMWQGEPGAAVLLAGDLAGEVPPVLILKSA